MKDTTLEDLYQEIIRRNKPLGKYFNRTDLALFNEGLGKHKLHVLKAQGCFIEDPSGHKYIDTGLGAGTHILGYAPAVVAKAMAKQVKEGTLFIAPNEYMYEVGGMLKSILKHFYGFVFCNSGAEATMRAVRIARAFTGKKKIAFFSGGWHGGHDVMLFEDNYQGADGCTPEFKSAGVPEEFRDMIVMLPYNDPKAFEMIEKHKDDLAMVIIEPSQGSNPRDDVKDFLNQLRAVTAKNNILLCFDEIISGFRVALGGCQDYYGIKADLATYGKTVGGGMPIGVIAGKKEVMDVIKGGQGKKSVFMGGTFSANPLTMQASRTLLKYLITHKKTIYPYLDKQGKRMRREINNFCKTKNIPVRMIGIASMSRLIFTDYPINSRRDRDQHEADYTFQEKFYTYLLLNGGVHVSGNRTLFLSTAHKESHVKKIIQAFQETLIHFYKS